MHTNDPGLAIQKALTYGQLSRMKIDNMREEHQEKLIRDAEKLAAQQAEEEKKAEAELNIRAVEDIYNGFYCELPVEKYTTPHAIVDELAHLLKFIA